MASIKDQNRYRSVDPKTRPPRPLQQPAPSRLPKGVDDIRKTKEYKAAARRYVRSLSVSFFFFLLWSLDSKWYRATVRNLILSISRWTTTIVGLPILMYTSYILYERREFFMLRQSQHSLDCTYTNLSHFSLCWQESQAAWRCAGTEGLIHFSLFLILLKAEFYVRSKPKWSLRGFTTVYKKS